MLRLIGVSLTLLAAFCAAPLRADTFRDIGAAPPRAMRSVAPSADPDLELPTEDIHPHPAVVRIIVPENGSTSYGSGTLVDVNGQHGLVVTNWHVISEALSPPTVLFADGFRSLAQVVRVDRDWDLAALVIWRPNAQPVPLATAAPQPGERLSIAGYGKGPYRLASGPCTKYLQPSTGLPHEMVELQVIARQGDSGGPIFNARGELAGVLWGEGNGYTTGSYCGRVRQFLSTIVPNNNQPSEHPPAVPPSAPADSTAATLVSIQSPAAANLAVSDQQASSTTLASRPQIGSGSGQSAQPTVPAPAEDSISFDWPAWVGRTRGEQAKTMFAVVGACALLLRIRRAISSEPAAA